MKYFCSAIVAALLVCGSVSAEVIVDHDFSAAQGFKSGKLQFQNEWLGQDGSIVDSSGAGVMVAEKPYVRNLYRRGGKGTIAGSAADGLGDGFDIGDRVRISYDFSVAMTGAVGATLSSIGVRSNYSTGGYEAGPQVGFRIHYTPWPQEQGGSLKFFGSLSRNVNSAEDNAYALIVMGDQIGLQPSQVLPDLNSDLLRVKYEVEKVADKLWQILDFQVHNLDSNVVVADSSSKPMVLETFNYEGWEMYLACRWGESENGIVKVGALKFEYLPKSDRQKAPEPAILAFK